MNILFYKYDKACLMPQIFICWVLKFITFTVNKNSKAPA